MARRKELSRHHIRNRCRGGDKSVANILIIYREKHDVWHKLFKNKTFREAAAMLLRAARMKERQYA